MVLVANYEYTVDLWTVWGLGAPTFCSVENPCITSHSALRISGSASLDSTNHWLCTCAVKKSACKWTCTVQTHALQRSTVFNTTERYKWLRWSILCYVTTCCKLGVPLVSQFFLRQFYFTCHPSNTLALIIILRWMGQLEGEEAGSYILGGVAVYSDLRV